MQINCGHSKKTLLVFFYVLSNEEHCYFEGSKVHVNISKHNNVPDTMEASGPACDQRFLSTEEDGE